MYQETPLHVSALSNKQVGGDILQLLLQGKEQKAKSGDVVRNYDGHTVLRPQGHRLHWYVHSAIIKGPLNCCFSTVLMRE